MWVSALFHRRNMCVHYIKYVLFRDVFNILRGRMQRYMQW